MLSQYPHLISETLYTNLPLNKLIKELSEVVDFVFDAGNSSYITISDHGKAYWQRKNPIQRFISLVIH